MSLSKDYDVALQLKSFNDALFGDHDTFQNIVYTDGRVNRGLYYVERDGEACHIKKDDVVVAELIVSPSMGMFLNDCIDAQMLADAVLSVLNNPDETWPDPCVNHDFWPYDDFAWDMHGRPVYAIATDDLSVMHSATQQITIRLKDSSAPLFSPDSIQLLRKRLNYYSAEYHVKIKNPELYRRIGMTQKQVESLIVDDLVRQPRPK